MGVELDIFVVCHYQVVLHSRIGKVNQMPSSENAVEFEHLRSSLNDDINSFSHPAAFGQHAFNPDDDETGYKNYRFEPKTTTDPYGGKPIISTISETLNHFNKMIEHQPLWKKHKGFIRTKKMLEILYDDVSIDKPDLIIDGSNSDSNSDSNSNLDVSNQHISLDDVKKAELKQKQIQDYHRVIFWFY